MTLPGDTESDQSGDLKCPKCQAPCTPGDRFCRSCGLELRDNSKVIEAYLAKVVPERIDDALKARLKEQKVVEIETAAMLAERAMSWLKTFAFFIGIPALFCVAALSALGIKTYSDFEKASQKAEKFEKTVSDAQEKFGGVQKRVDGLDESLKAAETRITHQLDKLDEQQKNLQTEVKGIQDKLRFCPTKNLSSQLRSSLETQLGGFIKYLEKIGFQNLDDQVTVCIFSKDSPIEGIEDKPDSFYQFDRRTINIHEDLTSDPAMILRQYMHYALVKVSPAALSSLDADVLEIESGLADYLPSSFLGNAKVGEKLGPIFKLKTSYIRNLDNDLKYSQAQAKLLDRGEVWAGAFWRCRAELGRDVVDPTLVKAWLDVAPDIAESGTAKKFGAAIATRERAATTKSNSCIAQQIAQRGLPQ